MYTVVPLYRHYDLKRTRNIMNNVSTLDSGHQTIVLVSCQEKLFTNRHITRCMFGLKEAADNQKCTMHLGCVPS